MSVVVDSLGAMAILHHDYPSAASLHAVLVLDDLAGDSNAVTHHGIDVLGIDATLPATLDDLQDWTAHRGAVAELGWDLPRPRLHPPTVAAHAVERACDSAQQARRWRLACYRGHWLDGVDLGDWDALAALGRQADLDPAMVHAVVSDRVEAARIRREMMAVRGDGVGGVPVLDVAGTKVSPFMDRDDLAQVLAL